MIATTLLTALLAASSARPMFDLDESVYLPGGPILVRAQRRNADSAPLRTSPLGAGSPVLSAFLVPRQGSRAIPLAPAPQATPSESDESSPDRITNTPYGSLIAPGERVTEFTSFLVPASLPPGAYALRLVWSYEEAKEPSNVPERVERGAADLTVRVAEADPARLGRLAMDLVDRARIGEWKGESHGGLGGAALAALFSMDPRVAGAAWRRFATEPLRNDVNGVPNVYFMNEFAYAPLLALDTPEAVQTLALHARRLREVVPQQWDAERGFYLAAFEKFSRSAQPSVVRAALRATSDVSEPGDAP